ncbi:MASE1 domain-containing protein [Cereibacter sphaeroides]|uniref:sensor histidine kinase n=1 Tax=Cereibacter sphaeroides TaxID=1063 RepID=UPI001F1CBD35|nr:MASE1 domain-containing protein [Cereibacter sphaeroides]MCE6959381.1 MASE1 domain-containing protein [Cereibacter sphaeroides]MCE6973848.1 MASE1 domain-containing protein [Cereibacter sphaeroides]
MSWVGSSAPRGREAEPSLPLLLSLVVTGYILMGKLGLATAMPPAGTVIFWAPNAILLVGLLSTAPRRWPVLLAGALVAEVAVDWPEMPLHWALAFGLVNCFEATLAAALLTRFSAGPVRLAGLGSFVRFVVLAPVFASGVAALGGALIIKLRFPDISYLHYWRVFWLGDALGVLLVATALLVWLEPGRRFAWRDRFDRLEAAALAMGVATVSVIALMRESNLEHIYLLFPLLLWAALRFRIEGATVAVGVTTGIALWAVAQGRGPFIDLSAIERVGALQLLIAVVALSTFMLAFSADDRRNVTRRLEGLVHDLQQAQGTLERMNADLDARVTERTQALQATLARNEMLLREVHHRVKNNLQLISSLVALQRRGVEAPEMRERLARIQGQIGAIATTYDLLHRLEGSESVDFGPFVPALCDAIAVAEDGRARIAAEVSGAARVDADAAIALSLALNELVTNALKHAGPRPEVRVVCRREGDELILCVEDDGPGFPKDFDLHRQKGFGVRMVSSLIGQAQGSVRLPDTGRGAAVEIRVPVS